MNKVWSPDTLAAPAANYHQCALVSQPSRWLNIAGQLGIDRQGKLAPDAEGQIVQAWENLYLVLQANEMGLEDLVSVRIYLVDRDDLPQYQAAKSRLRFDVGGLPTTLIFVQGLFDPHWRVEIEAQAAKAI
ncbi:RidA family protein [Shewanella insulae]|uniref:RidA family protein n=1 Tax=Shewanella insulae TaxID=2681496 RepID=UPI001EFDB91D|nr:RidA family protein [Shewanella insulae]MCG9739382.1 RidA family protein [Shewanella insulae]MCG9755196.1 RidA family protein [Shewanella insulae]